MKRTVLIVLLISLVLSEMFLFTGFLPSAWQHAIYEPASKMFPETLDQTSITHPNLDREIQDALRNDVKLRLGLYLVIALTLTVNTVLIRLVWRKLNVRVALTADRS